jgi:diguanylate cyclase (GGDEF)-like protein
MPRVALATGVEQIDAALSEELARRGVECAGECYYREGILPFCRQKKADTVIVSPELPGAADLAEVIVSLRESGNIRVVLLPGPVDLQESLELAQSVFWAGVYDLVFSTPSTRGSRVDVKDIAGHVLNPTTFAEARAMLASGGVLPGKAPLDDDRKKASGGDAPVSGEAAGLEGGMPEVREKDGGREKAGAAGQNRSGASQPRKPKALPPGRGAASPGSKIPERGADAAAPAGAAVAASGAQNLAPRPQARPQNVFIDSLTGLPVRESAGGMLLPARYAVLFCDLNGFKAVNDGYGHAVGDRILQEFAAVARSVVRETDHVIRWGGDEFVIILPGADEKDAQGTAARLRSQWALNFLASRYNMSVAVGVSSASRGVSLAEAVSHADKEMYRFKHKAAAGASRLFVVYNAELDDDLLKRIGKAGALVDADSKMRLSRSLDIKELWKSDWRLVYRAEPAVLPFGVEFYSLTPALGGMDGRDYEMFGEFIISLLAKKRVVVNVGEDARIEAELSRLGAASF